MNFIRKWALIFAHFIPFAANVFAQNYSYNWINYTTKHGLPSNHVFYCYQDKKGFMWFGTNLGVSKFDGNKFVNYNEKNGLTDIEISKIQEDGFGNLWVCSLWGNIYKFQNDSFIPFKFNYVIQSFKEKFRVVIGFDIKTEVIDSIISFYMGLDYFGLLKINSNGQKFEFSTEQMKSVILYKSDKISFATSIIKYKNIYQLNKELLEPINFYELINDRLQFKFKNIYINGINGCYYNLLDNHYFGTVGYLYKYKIGNLQIVPSVRNCYDVVVCNDGRVLMGQINNEGLLEFRNLECISRERPLKLLENVSVGRITLDASQGCWVTTTDDGVFYLGNKNLYKLRNDEKSNSKTNYKKLKVVDYGSALWYSNENQELTLYNLRTNKFKTLKLAKQIIKDILPVPKSKNVYIAGTTRTSYIENSTIRNIVDELDFDKFVSKKLVFNKVTKSVFAFNHWGLFEFRKDSILFRLNSSFSTRMSNQRILSIYMDPNDTLWVVKKDGIYHFDLSNRVLVKSLLEFQDSTIISLHRLSKNCFLFISPSKGIIIKDSDTTFILNMESGLQSNNIIEVKSNGLNKFYIHSNSGIDQVEYEYKNRVEIKSIRKVRDLEDLNINDFDIDSNGIWMATTNGIYFKENEAEDTNAPIPFLEEIFVEKKKPGIGFLSIQNPLLIRWNCINYSLKGRMTYRYRMNTTEPWIYTKSNQLSLNDYKPKQYRLEVQAQNSDGHWSNSMIQEIQIRKPWFKTNMFYFIVVLLIFYFIIRYYQIQNRKLQNEISLKLELAELERKLFSVQMNPHFLFNCLTSIQLLIRQRDYENASNYLTKFAILTRSVLNFVKCTIITVEDEVQFLNQYLALEKLRFKDNFIYNVSVDPEINNLDVAIPSLLVQPFVENSIKYGLKSKEHILNISIDFRLSLNNCLLITISDNGPGLNLENNTKSSEEFNKIDSVGINLSRQRINKHNITSNIDGLKIKVEKMKDNAVLGTTVEILLLIG